MAHALVIGGTGMLKGAVLHLLAKFDTVSVIARNEDGFKKLREDSGNLSSSINELRLDYTHYIDLTNAAIKSVKDFGEIDLVISWIHSSAPLAPVLIAKVINDTSGKCNFYEILGSSRIHPENDKAENKFKDFENITYHTVLLGFIIENNTSRWLTNKEISNGVLMAIESGESNYIVGTITPWNRRP
jgi:hypothetical protein